MGLILCVFVFSRVCVSLKKHYFVSMSKISFILCILCNSVFLCEILCNSVGGSIYTHGQVLGSLCMLH